MDTIFCNGDKGGIHFTASGGTAPYMYSIDSAQNFFSVADTSGLDPGTYYTFVSDANGCIVAGDTINLTEPPAIVIDSLTYQNPLLCAGDSTDIIIHALGGTGTLEYSINDGASFQADSIFAKQDTGVYIIVMRDSEGCLAYGDTITITQPEPILYTGIDITDNLCNGDTAGIVAIGLEGGIPPYAYSIDGGSNFQTDSAFINLPSGNYDVVIFDANGCIRDTSITVAEPTPIVYSTEMDTIFCNGDKGGIHFTASGGTAPYMYSIDSAQNFFSVADTVGLDPGTYYTFVSDANGCIVAGDTINLTEPSAIQIDSLTYQNSLLCAGDSSDIIIHARGGSGMLGYSINNAATFQADSVFGQQPAGVYITAVRDTNGCIAFGDTITISQPQPLLFTDIDITNNLCAEDTAGIIAIGVSGGTSPYFYSIDGGNTLLADSAFVNLAPGNYNIWVTDANGCTRDSTVAISSPDSIKVDEILVSPVSCNSGSTGTIEISATGGMQPYTYRLFTEGIQVDSLVSDTSVIFDTLVAGAYIISINDVNMCGPINSDTVFITEPAPLVYDSIEYSEFICSGNPDGFIHMYISGGTEPYNFLIDGTPTTDSITGLIGGSYTVSISDSAGCSLPDTTITITQSAIINVDSIYLYDVSCAGGSDGAIRIEASGGSGDLMYSIDNGINYLPTDSFINLSAGAYPVRVSDSIGCELPTRLVTIDEPDSIKATFTVVPYIDEDTKGAITVHATGGNPPYLYSIDEGVTLQSDSLFTDLELGLYTITIVDTKGCSADFMVTVSESDMISVQIIAIQDVSCPQGTDGYAIFAISDNAVEYPVHTLVLDVNSGDTIMDVNLNSIEFNFGPSPAGLYEIFMTDVNDREFTTIFEIEQPDPILINATVVDANCEDHPQGEILFNSINGGTPNYGYVLTNSVGNEITPQSNGDFVNLVDDSYTLRITDGNSCSIDTSIVISATHSFSAEAGNSDGRCLGSNELLDGSSSEIVEQANTIYEWKTSSGNVVATTEKYILTNIMESRTYILTVTDTELGCVATDSVTVSIVPSTPLDIVQDTLYSSFEATWLIDVEAQEDSFASFSWQPVTGLNDPSLMEPDITVTESGNYHLIASDINGCLSIDSITVILVEDVIVFTGFTPNGDGYNDYWHIENAEGYPNCQVDVFNRWGEKIFSTGNYDNVSNVWDGTRNGKPVPVGTYYYVIKKDAESDGVAGTVTVVR